MTPTELEKIAQRFLVVIYDLADGRTDKSVNRDEALQYANRIGLKGMTDEEFEAYRLRVMKRVAALN